MVTAVAPRPKNYIRYFVWRVLQERKVGKLLKVNQFTDLINLARSRSAECIMRHTECFDYNVVKLLGSFSARGHSINDKYGKYFDELLGLSSRTVELAVQTVSWIFDWMGRPALEWTLSSIKTLVSSWISWAVQPQRVPFRYIDVVKIGCTGLSSLKIDSAGDSIRLLVLFDAFSALWTTCVGTSEH